MKKENPLRNQPGSFGANENSLSRRGFLKRSGGATAATVLAWGASYNILRGSETGTGTGDDTPPPPPPPSPFHGIRRLNPVGIANKDETSENSTITVDGQTYEVYWKFEYLVELSPARSVNQLVEMDCLTCKVSNVKLVLEGLPSFASGAAVSSASINGPTVKRGVTLTKAGTPTDPKVSGGPISGDQTDTAGNITISVVPEISPEKTVETYRIVTWKVDPSNAIDQAGLQVTIEAEIEALGHNVTQIDLPAIPAMGVTQRSQSAMGVNGPSSPGGDCSAFVNGE